MAENPTSPTLRADAPEFVCGRREAEMRENPTSPTLRADAPEFVPGGAAVPSDEMEPTSPPKPSEAADPKVGKTLSLEKALAPEPDRRMPTAVECGSEVAMIYAGSSLTDVVDTLEYSGHSSAVYVSEDGSVKGVLTENDILKAYSEEANWEHDVEQWLQSGQARLPGFLLPMHTVDASMPLVDAAAKMAVQRLTHYACHHLLVEGGALGRHHILSALDIIVALCNGDLGPDAVGKEATVSDVMKPRGVVPECKGSDSIKAAFDFLLSSEQNCALVVEEEAGFVYGTITPRDAMRAFGEHIPEGTAIAGWLRGVGASLDPRRIDAGTPLIEAAQAMVSNTLHHLCVVEPSSNDVVGVISCLDIVCRIAELRLDSTSSLPAGVLDPSPSKVGPDSTKQEDSSRKKVNEDSHPAWQ